MDKKKSCEKSCINWIFGFLFALAMSFGYQLQNNMFVDLKNIWTYISILVIGVAVSFLVKFVWGLMAKKASGNGTTLKEAEERPAVPEEKEAAPVADKKFKNRTWLSSSVLVWICHFIVFLGEYPGFFVYDAQDELMETVMRTFSTHHPLMHVLSMGAVVQGVHKVTGEYNIAIACFILLGMTIAAVTYGYLVYRLRKMGMKKIGAIILTLWFGIFPVFVMYSLCSSKDGVFGCFLILSFLFIKELLEDTEGFFSSWKKPVVLVAALTLMMLFRNNGVYALAAFAVIYVLWGLICKKKGTFPDGCNEAQKTDRRAVFKGLGIIVVSVVLYIIVNSAMATATNAYTGEKKEILTVPIMQLARTYTYELGGVEGTGQNEASVEEKKASGENADSEVLADRKEIERYIGTEGLEHYNLKVSDMVKWYFDEEEFEKDPKGFLNIWWKLAKEHPATYVNAALGTSFGMWYPWAMIDAYKGNVVFTFTYGDSSYFAYEVEEPGFRDPKIPVIDDIYRWFSLDPTIQKIPVIHLLFSPGFMFWVYLFFMGYFIYAKEAGKALGYLLPFFVVLTCLLGPLSLVRYSFFLWALVPVQMRDL